MSTECTKKSITCSFTEHKRAHTCKQVLNKRRYGTSLTERQDTFWPCSSN